MVTSCSWQERAPFERNSWILLASSYVGSSLLSSSYGAMAGKGVVPACAPCGEEAASGAVVVVVVVPASSLRRAAGPWLLSSVPPVLGTSPAAGAAAGDRGGFCSVRRFTEESSAAAVKEPENGLMAGGDQVSKELALKMYSEMVTLQVMDTIFFEVQRQGRISFYLTSHGEEAINIASAAALIIDGTASVQGTWCSSMAWLYYETECTSEGDFHAALNFAAVMEAPVIFSCRNNGWAISTPTSEQFRSDGAVIRGQAYGMRSIRIDGNDALAVYSAVHAAKEMAIKEGRPVLVEALTYQVGHHSTSDDSTKYRPVDEIEHF